MRAWLRRKLHIHRWETTRAQRPHNFGLGQEMATGTVRRCARCFLVNWDTFEILGPTVRLEKEARERSGWTITPDGSAWFS